MDEKLKRDYLDILRAIVNEDGVSPEIASKFLGVSYRTVYRWLSTETAFFVTRADMEKLYDFFKQVDAVNDSWRGLLLEYPKMKKGLHRAVLTHFVNGQIIRTIENKNLSDKEKARQLTIKTLRAWGKHG
jgi:hypothetical protein